MRTMAERRHHEQRLRKKRRHHWGQDLLLNRKRLGKAVTTPTPHTCSMSGNPRTYFGARTIQELKAEESEKYQLKEALATDPLPDNSDGQLDPR